MKAIQREILFSFWKMYILHDAAAEPVVGQWLLRELRHHGYQLSPGTRHPILPRMARLGWLRSETDTAGWAKAKHSFYATESGKEVLVSALNQLQELRTETQPQPGKNGTGKGV